jgi:chromate reductase
VRAGWALYWQPRCLGRADRIRACRPRPQALRHRLATVLLFDIRVLFLDFCAHVASVRVNGGIEMIYVVRQCRVFCGIRLNSLVCYFRKGNYQEIPFQDFSRRAAMTRVLGFAGSLRKDSYNLALLRAAQKIAIPEGIEIEIFEIGGIPPYNQDDESDMPAVVREFKTGIEQADALLLVTPEYNYSVSGVLKNAIDWASRPHGANSFEDKPVAIMGATIGMLGTARAQYHLRQMLVYVNAYPLNRPEVMVPSAGDKFKDGELVDEHTRQKVREQLVALAAWAKRLHPA